MAAASDVRNLNGMFDREVVEAMRRQFNSADTDGNGQLDSREACKLFAKHCCPEGAGEEEIQRTASGLMNQLDTDRSGTISFEEYCFRFGRRYQVEAARRRRAGPAGGSSGSWATGRGGAAAPEAAGARAASAFSNEASSAGAQGAGGRAAESPWAVPEPSAPPFDGGSQQFAAGSTVALQGLRAAPELNGQRAKVLRFDAPAGRYVVELEAGGGQKSLRPENLTAAGASAAGSDFLAGAAATGRRWMEKAKTWLQRAIARVQVMLAEYEWWQIALGAAIVVLFVMAYFQVQGRYSGGGGGGAAGRRSRPRSSASQSHYADESWAGSSEESRRHDEYERREEGRRWEEPRGGDRRDYGGGRHHGGRRSERYDDFDEDFDRRPRDRRGSGPGGGGRYSYHEQDDYDDYGYGGGASGGSSGLIGYLLNGEYGQLTTLAVLGGLVYACWTGIIPVHRMSWFQLYMLWNFLEPLLLGGRGRGRNRGFGGGFGGGLGGFGRRGFF